jgi:23S rRNA (adenine1618-N6)-methyltransferase
MSYVPTNSSPTHGDGGLHSHNRHHGRYDFPRLVAVYSGLSRFVIPHPDGGDTVDFFDPAAVIALNRALLMADYGLAFWDLPPGALCPPIPGRVDYLHHVADLLAEDRGAGRKTESKVRVLDIGMGANCIYPILGVGEYGWRFVGTDTDAGSVAWAKKLVAANPSLKDRIECRHQPLADDIFAGAVRATERFTVSVCNPPFHASAAEAEAGTVRKLRNLSEGRLTERPLLNFGGQSNELWCRGGEVAFVRRMIAQSGARPAQCRWFTTLVSKRASLPAIERALHTAQAAEVRIIPMTHGQKHNRIVAWRFLERSEPPTVSGALI